MERTIILQKSKKKGKRYSVTMKGFPNMSNHMHEFGSDVGKTFIDEASEKQKKAWIARHSTNKNWDEVHSPVYYSRHILWGKNRDIKKNIKDLAKLLNSKIIVKGEL